MTETDRSVGAVRAESRRAALVVALGGAAALATGALGLALGFVGNALRQARPRTWLRLGPAEDLDPEGFERRVLAVEHTHAWRRERRPTVVFVRDRFPEDPICLGATCSHLGCSVRWDGESRRFRCPCHGGVYDEEGRVVSGPPPRDLTRLEVRLDEAEDVQVRFPEREGGAA